MLSLKLSLLGPCTVLATIQIMLYQMQHVKKKQLCWSVHKSVNPAENLALKSPEIHVVFFFFFTYMQPTMKTLVCKL